jgi:hypothetical protein
MCRVEDNTFKGAAMNYIVLDGATVKVQFNAYDFHKQGIAYAYMYNNDKYTTEQLETLFNVSARKTAFWKKIIKLIKDKDFKELDKLIDALAISERLFLESYVL